MKVNEGNSGVSSLSYKDRPKASTTWWRESAWASCAQVDAVYARKEAVELTTSKRATPLKSGAADEEAEEFCFGMREAHKHDTEHRSEARYEQAERGDLGVRGGWDASSDEDVTAFSFAGTGLGFRILTPTHSHEFLSTSCRGFEVSPVGMETQSCVEYGAWTQAAKLCTHYLHGPDDVGAEPSATLPLCPISPIYGITGRSSAAATKEIGEQRESR
ncbi:hypothetical protein FB451DRAFT_1186672 [Mycena latifolia]|nr:hypothetical protein FB451DRAFT_1186672 [Mycena latifolia]